MQEDIQLKLQEIKEVVFLMDICTRCEDDEDIKASSISGLIAERMLRPLVEDLMYLIDEWRVG